MDNDRKMHFLSFSMFVSPKPYLIITSSKPVKAGTGELKTSPNEPELGGKMKSSSSGSIPPALKNVKDLQQSPVNSNVDIFTYEEMRLATKHFQPDLIIGEGGFGIVYKGVIDDSVRQGYKTTKVAIKELNPEGFQGDREWLVQTLTPVFSTSPLSHQAVKSKWRLGQREISYWVLISMMVKQALV